MRTGPLSVVPAVSGSVASALLVDRTGARETIERGRRFSGRVIRFEGRVHACRGGGGHDFPWDRCGVSITGLSCPSPALCVGVDSNGQVLTHKAPTGWTQSGNGETFGAYDGVPCGSESLCVAICSLTLTCSTDGAGTVIAWNPRTEAPPQPDVPGLTVSTHPLTGVWCVSDSLCFVSDGLRLFGSTNPRGPTSGWTIVDRSAGAVSGLSCAVAPSCVAVTTTGELLLGSPPPRKAQITAVLIKQLIPRASGAKIGRVKKTGGYVLAFNPPVAGRLLIAWYSIPARHGSKPLLVARTASKSVKARPVLIRLRLTDYGARLMRGARRLRLTARANFTSAGNPGISATRVITLYR